MRVLSYGVLESHWEITKSLCFENKLSLLMASNLILELIPQLRTRTTKTTTRVPWSKVAHSVSRYNFGFHMQKHAVFLPPNHVHVSRDTWTLEKTFLFSSRLNSLVQKSSDMPLFQFGSDGNTSSLLFETSPGIFSSYQGLLSMRWDRRLFSVRDQ